MSDKVTVDREDLKAVCEELVDNAARSGGFRAWLECRYCGEYTDTESVLHKDDCPVTTANRLLEQIMTYKFDELDGTTQEEIIDRIVSSGESATDESAMEKIELDDNDYDEKGIIV